MKGIILAGGSGTRLYPITKGISKQLMPIYDKPMIYYPLSTLISGGIREILIITTPQDSDSFQRLLGDGTSLGCKFEYAVQPSPDGLAQAFIIGEEFIGNDSVCLILGDNLFYGDGFDISFKNAIYKVENKGGGVVFAYHVKDPERYGVVQFDEQNNVVSIEEKPKNPQSSYAIPGIYFFDNQVIEMAKLVKPSERGELEIPEIHNMYLKQGQLGVQTIDRGNAWLDTGTMQSMVQASQFIQVVEERQNLKVGCIEEAAFKNGLISKEDLIELAQPLRKSGYGEYLLGLL
jgi:glucose-1-phosphate thymidylyltransferase